MSTSVSPQTRVDYKIPSMWKVVMHNDNYTPIDFVVWLLVNVFRKNEKEAIGIAERVHNNGQASVGLYVREIAETKVRLSTLWAERFEHPLRLTAEEA